MKSRAHSRFVWRVRIVRILLSLFAIVLMIRAADLHVNVGEFLRGKGRFAVTRTHTIEIRRGRIYDRNGLLLAATVPKALVWADPMVLAPPNQESLNALAGLTGHSRDRLDRIISIENRDQYVVLARNLEWDDAREIQKLGIEGAYSTRS